MHWASAYWVTPLRNARLGLTLAIMTGMASCRHEPPPLPPAHPHYVIGSGWQGNDGWFYPAESFNLHQTGLAVLQTDTSPHITADGEIWSADSMTGAHQSLQLPAIVTVRNLLNGRTVRIRLNDRGPRAAGRILAVTPEVGALLEIGTEPMPIELRVDEAASRAIAELSPDAPKLAISAAPRGDVTAQSLDGGAAQTVGEHQMATRQTTGALELSPLPIQVSQSFATPVSYIVALGSFAGHAPAAQVALRCGGNVRPSTESEHSLNWQAWLGPYQSVAQADTALARARSCGIAGAQIAVE